MGAERDQRLAWFGRRRVAAALASGLLLVGAAGATGSASGRASSARSGCAMRGPIRAHHNPWSRAKEKMAPRGARTIRICRYAGVNASPSFRLVGSHVVVRRGLKHRIISRLDALKPYSGPPPHCPHDSGEAIGVTLFYKDGHQVGIVVYTSGCPGATNGDIARPAWNTSDGRHLVEQLKALTPPHHA
jgi:hypothetical protein